jgi:hypothetical protein
MVMVVIFLFHVINSRLWLHPWSHPILIHSFDLDYGTVMMDSCYTSDVILQRIHFVRSSSFAVNIDIDIFEACQILQPKDQATVPVLELAPCRE